MDTAGYTYTDDNLTKFETGTTAYTFACGDFSLRSSIKVGMCTQASYTYTDRNHYLAYLAYGNGDSAAYTCDDYGRVTKETYEDGGNILSRTEYAYTTGTPGTPLDTVTYVYGNTTWGDLLTKHDGNTVTSDVNGNMTAYGKTKTYTWEHGRELSSLTQPAPMAITKQPSDVKGILGTAISFSVTAKGEGLSYQWQVSSNGGSTWGDTSANGYNTNTISGFTMTEARDGNMYRCIVTDVSGNVRISDPAEIILVPIAITKQPSNCYGSVGTPVTFSVTAKGSNLSYQWQVSTNGGSTWGNTSANGATTNTISGFDITEARDGNMYRCVITDGDGNTVTSSAKSIIATDLAITKQPGTFKGLLGDTVTLSVNAYGSSLTYRWQVSTDGGTTWSNSSATGYNTKTISGFELTEARNGNMYRCIVTDGNGNTVTSNAGEISVITETWQYTYDADGLRTKATNGHNTYEYTYDGGKLTSMKVDDKVLYFFYDGNGKPWYFLYNNTKYFYATNLQGDVTAIMTVSGSTKVKYTYDAWGNILSITGSSAATLGELNPLRYRGYVYDQPTGLYYLQSRYYSPELGRFINADVYPCTGQGLTGNNMFAYCGNNPVSRSDDGGEFWNIVVGAVIGAVVNTVVSYAAAKMAGEEFSLADAGVAFASGAITGAVAATGLGAIGQAVVGGAVGFGGSVANNLLEGEKISWESAAINGVAGFAGGLIGGNGIRKTGGKLDIAKKALDHAATLKNSGAKMVRNTVTKNLKKAAAAYAEVYATESLITLGRFYAGAWGAAIISKGGTQFLK